MSEVWSEEVVPDKGYGSRMLDQVGLAVVRNDTEISR